MKKKSTPNKIGHVQKAVLQALKTHGKWFSGFGSGWLWDTPSGTRKILDSLVKKGLVRIGTYTLRDGTKYVGAYMLTKEGGRENER